MSARSSLLRHRWSLFGLALAAALLAPMSVALCAPADLGVSALLNGEESGPLTARIIQLFGLLTVLSLAPGLLIMVTSFTRIVVVLSFLRSGLGLQQSPPNVVIVSLALFLTAYVMAPTFDKTWEQGLEPLLRDRISEGEALPKITEPFRAFMLANVREKELGMFGDLFETLYEKQAGGDVSTDAVPAEAAVDFRVLIPAFMISELRKAFEIGFLVCLPFLVIDMIVATVLMAMGMMMLPPVVVSLPFKILFFVLIDGWYLLSTSLVRSFG